jgi:hypothetical protein
MLLDMRVAGVGFKTWSIPGKANVKGVFVKGEAFMQQLLLQMFLWARPRSMRARPSCSGRYFGLLDLILFKSRSPSQRGVPSTLVLQMWTRDEDPLYCTTPKPTM